MGRLYTHALCRVCTQERDFKILEAERDLHGRRLMVCTRCGSKVLAPGEPRKAPPWSAYLPGRDG